MLPLTLLITGIEIKNIGNHKSPSCLYSRSCPANISIKIVNVSEPINPIQLSHHAESIGCLDVQITNNLAVVSQWHDGLEIIDISNPNNPIMLLKNDDCRDTKMVYVEDELIFVADGLYGLVIFEMKYAKAGLSIPSFELYSLFLSLSIFSIYSKLMRKRM